MASRFWCGPLAGRWPPRSRCARIEHRFFDAGVPVARRVEPVEPPVPRAPTGLRQAGRKLWREINRELILDSREQATLERACRLADRAAELDDLIRSDGLMVPGSTGQQRLNPALSEQRQLQATIGRLLALIKPPPAPAQQRAHRAASRRWQ
jgi:hypothetical protein